MAMHDEDMSLAFRRFIIMLAGAMTTLATWVLGGVADLWEAVHSFWFLVIPIPVGAMAVGFVAASGYGVSAWFLTRLRFTTAMLKAIAVSMLLTYGVLAYIDYVQHGPDDMGFFAYFHETTVNAYWDDEAPSIEDVLEDPTSMPEPLGGDGYGYRFAEILGLLVGSMSALIVVPGLRRRYGLDPMPPQ